MRLLCTILLMSLSVAVKPALAQEDPGSEESLLLRGTNRALSFTIDDLSLGTLDGGVGMRWFIGQRTALRATLRLNVESTEDVVQGQSDTGRSAFGVGSTFLVEWHTRSFRRVSPYIGAGAGVQFDAYSETRELSADNQLVRQRDKGTVVDFHVNAGMGVEVYLSKSISLSGEYLFTAAVRSLEGQVVNTYRDAPETTMDRDLTSFRFGTGASSLILSIFF